MNRPNIDDYLVIPNNVRTYANVKWGYYFDLEKYCDELEKALDKACELLSLSMPYIPINKCPNDIDCFNGGHLKNKEEWKATCLDDKETLNDSWKPKVIKVSEDE